VVGYCGRSRRCTVASPAVIPAGPDRAGLLGYIERATTPQTLVRAAVNYLHVQIGAASGQLAEEAARHAADELVRIGDELHFTRVGRTQIGGAR
jgi:hypothetical protein